MSSVSPPVRGSIVDPCDDLPRRAIQPIQPPAVAAPDRPARALAAGRRMTGAALARYVNDFLSDPSVK